MPNATATRHREQQTGGKRVPTVKYPAPPLDGTGHAWHHPKKILLMTIRDGTGKLGGSMPAWGSQLSEQDMNDIIT